MIKSICFSVLISLSAALIAQNTKVNVSGSIKDKLSAESLPYVNIVLKKTIDSSFVTGTISNENGLFIISDIDPGEYYLESSYIGYSSNRKSLFIGSNSSILNLGTILLEGNAQAIGEVVISAKHDQVYGALDKKTFAVDDNVSQGGGSVLQAMNNLPGVTTQDGQVQLRGNSQVMVLIDGKQTAVTGFGNQNGLDNLPASAIERIEIINNPSAKYDANGNAGIINIILKKEEQKGFNGKLGLTTGLGALWVRKENLVGIRPQYTSTPKLNPSISLNYRKKKINLFLQADNLYTETLNKNEFVTRTYSDGSIINQQLKRNRNTNFYSTKLGFDWFLNEKNTLTISGLYSQENIKDYGDQPFFNGNNNESLRLWQFIEDEVLTAAMASAVFQHNFQQPGHQIKLSYNYTFDRENEKYFFTNSRNSLLTNESFFLIADQKVSDLSLDYTKPLKHGVLETGFKFRKRTIPTNMQFNPSATNSVLDTGADGRATYAETIPAVYGTYTYEVKKLEAELGLRMEYVKLNYTVDPNHNTYKSDGYSYFQPFPNTRITYKVNEQNKISAFYNRRVTRPDEGDIRIFPKYDDAEIIKVGKPGLQPQFTNSFEIGYKHTWEKGYFYAAGYHRISTGTITRIATTVDSSNLIYAISQNAGKSYNSGIELLLNQSITDKITLNFNLNVYKNTIDAFSVINQYPRITAFTAEKQEIYSGNLKITTNFKLAKNTVAQLTAIYLAPDIIPQGTIASRFSLDAGLKKVIQQGKGEIFINATDLLNTMIIRKKINGDTFNYTSKDYYETQVIRLGYAYKF